MTGEECRGYINEIHSFYGKEYPREALQKAWPHFKDEPVKAMYRAIERLMMENTNSMPPLQRVVDLVRQEGAKIRQAAIVEREQTSEREKKEIERGMERAFKDDKGIAKQTVALIQDMLAGKKTRDEYLDGIRDLDRNFPHAGFAIAGGQLQNYYQTNGLPMDGKPRQDVYDD